MTYLSGCCGVEVNMSGRLRSAVTNTVVVGGVVFVGWTLMTALTPNKQQMMERLSIDPNEHISAKDKRNKQLYATIQQNIQSSDPVWKIKPLEVNKRPKTNSFKDNSE